jgi:hypothetical protein
MDELSVIDEVVLFKTISTDPLRVNERALFRVVDDEAVILNMDDGQYYGLNEVATRVWQLLSEGQNMEEVTSRLLSEFETDEATLLADLTELLDELLAKRLVLRGG